MIPRYVFASLCVTLSTGLPGHPNFTLPDMALEPAPLGPSLVVPPLFTSSVKDPISWDSSTSNTCHGYSPAWAPHYYLPVEVPRLVLHPLPQRDLADQRHLHRRIGRRREDPSLALGVPNHDQRTPPNNAECSHRTFFLVCDTPVMGTRGAPSPQLDRDPRVLTRTPSQENEQALGSIPALFL
ncbi:hypothetical protein LX32DRAFT_71025 [Colletotrichum zoysiae]|uniref:Uncharacterized protein n=1 Tax=Colletotrichum zoysiae TaxID=1216348 RepID=A0AAD9HA39_9PEZI|nr:hypothetical protein LX32DRAFT_71025 [Colletotrichum zoysiae]